MRILIINGSPKGKNSVTLQTALYLKKLHPEHEFVLLNAGQQTARLEKDFESAKKSLEKADLIIFLYPVYTFAVPAQLYRFIELISENNVDINGKYASQISTSMHFYDVTAHSFIEDNCKDLGLKYIRGISAGMNDLLKAKGRFEARGWFDWLIYSIKEDASKKRRKPEAKKDDFSAVIVHDCAIDDTSLRLMIDYFKEIFPYSIKEVNLLEFPFSGGCLGCFNCAADGKCVYKDGFDDYLRNEIQTQDAIIYAFRIKNHLMGSRFKMYDDRQFCNGHRTVTSGTPMAYIISGDYAKEQNLRLMIEARSEVGGNFLCGAATDEKNPEAQIDRLCDDLCYALEHKCARPKNFYGRAGSMIFRDLIYQMRGMMKADHKYFKEHNLYDFPQKDKKTIWMMRLVGLMLSNPKLRKKISGKMNEYMTMPYKKVLAEAKPEANVK